jgi:hypothetical protein
MKTNIKPLHDRVIVKRIDEGEQARGGIIIPDTAKEKSQEGEVIVEKVRAERNANFVYNAATDKFEDLVAAGIIDPAKVTRCKTPPQSRA